VHRSIARVVRGAVFATLLCSGVAFAQTFNAGLSPQSVTQPCSLYIPVIVAIQIQDTVKFIIAQESSSVGDTLWPKYKLPTYPGESPYSYVWYWTNNLHGARVSTKGPGIMPAGISLGQFYHAPAPEPKTADGQSNPAGHWVAFTSSDVAFDSTTTSGVGHANLDYEFKWEAGDPPLGAVITLTYTVTAR